LIEVPCGGGGGNGNAGGNGTPTEPIGFPPMDGSSNGGSQGGGDGNSYNYFLNSLTNNQIVWLNSNNNVKVKIFNYLQLNNYSVNAEDFAFELIVLLSDIN